MNILLSTFKIAMEITYVATVFILLLCYKPLFILKSQNIGKTIIKIIFSEPGDTNQEADQR